LINILLNLAGLSNNFHDLYDLLWNNFIALFAIEVENLMLRILKDGI